MEILTDPSLTSSSSSLKKGSKEVVEESDIYSQIWKDGEEFHREEKR